MKKMVKSLEIILCEPQLKEKKDMHLCGCHIEEEPYLFGVPFVAGTMKVHSGQKVYQSRHSSPKNC